MRIEIKASGSEQELADFRERLSEGQICVFLTSSGRLGIDFGADVPGRIFLSRVKVESTMLNLHVSRSHTALPDAV